MRLRVRHKIRQTFEAPARNVTRVLRLTPRSHEGQHVIDWRLDVDVDCILKTGEDGFGNITHTFTAKGPCEELTVSVAGEVDTFDAAGVVRGSAERMPIELYLRETSLTVAGQPLRDFAGAATAGTTSVLGRLHALQDTLHEAMAFDPDLADGSTAADALVAKKGNSCDFAHVMATCARILGIPARVTGGYYLTGDKTRGLSHAWCEAHVDGLGWTGFDAANRICPQESHIRLASGLDYLAAAAVRGVGGAAQSEVLDMNAPFTLGWGQSQWQSHGPGGQSQRQGGQSQSQR